MTWNRRKLRVLCVDDSADMTAMFGTLLSLQPDLAFAGSLQHADEIVAEVKLRSADVVVIDLNLPGKPPSQTIGTLRELVPECKIIVYSGESSEALEQVKAHLNVHACVSKGEDPTVLLNTIRTVALTNQKQAADFSKP